MRKGGSGISPPVFEALVAMLNAGVHPLVPHIGSIGVGDLAPLSALALPLIGEGLAEFRGTVMPGAEALAAAAIAQPPLGPKDGLSLISSNAVTPPAICRSASASRVSAASGSGNCRMATPVCGGGTTRRRLAAVTIPSEPSAPIRRSRIS